jgi:hypothetical protein
MSIVAIVLLVAAAALLVMAESARFRRPVARAPRKAVSASRFRPRRRGRTRPKLEIVRPESEEFARSVERDLAALPTIDEHDVKRR